MKQNQLKRLCLCGVFAALTGILAQLSLPIGPVPISMATLGVMLCGLLLGKKDGCLSVLCYILLGAAGLPVFSGFRGGLSALLGPTGGYILGYLPYALLSGMAKKRSLPGEILLLLLGLAACYGLGTLWFVYQSGNPWETALSLCVLPFLPGDGLKTALALFLQNKMKKIPQ